MLEIEATVVSGFEAMAKEEIIEKLGSGDVKLTRGHVNFCVTDDNLLNVLKLRSVDNLYFIVNRFENVSFTENKEECLKKIYNLVYLVEWKSIIDTWQKFFTFNEEIDYSKILKTIQASFNSSESGHDMRNLNIEINKIDVELNSFNTNKNDNINKGINIHLDNSIQFITSIDSIKTEKIIKNETNISSILDNEIHFKTEIVNSNEVKTEKIDQTKKTIDNTKKEIDLNTTDEPVEIKKVKQCNEGMPSYRVTCNRNGTHSFQSPMAACEFGGAINDLLKWNVDLDHFDLEIMLIINENEVKIGIGLTAKSLHRRDLVKFGRTSLRPTIAYGMLRLCRPLPGDIISDPMCGCGSIPIEAAISYPDCFHLAGDIDNLSIERTYKNISNINRSRIVKDLSPIQIDAFYWDSGRLPLKENSLDIFITDLPFGKRMGSRATNWQLYPYILMELARVSRLGSGRACLLTQDRKCIQHVMNKLSNFWKRGPTVVTNIGGLTAAVFMLFRTLTPFNSDAIDP